MSDTVAVGNGRGGAIYIPVDAYVMSDDGRFFATMPFLCWTTMYRQVEGGETRAINGLTYYEAEVVL